MLSRTWSPLVALALLATFALSVNGEDKPTPSRVQADFGDMEFELKKCELEIQMADLGIAEAEIPVQHVEQQMTEAQDKKDDNAVQRLRLEHKHAEIQVEMRQLAKKAAQLEYERVRARLSRMKKPGKAGSALEGPVQVELLEDDVFVTRGKAEDVKRVVALIEELGRNSRTAPPKDEKQAAEIKELLKQRRDTLQTMVDVVVADFRGGKATHADVVRATDSLIAAELELASDKAKRVALHERRLKSLKELEDYTKAQHEAGIVGITDVFAAKESRIKAEIELLQERASSK